jgi:hypothetical protein
MLQELDNHISILSESVARGLSRRRFFSWVAKGVVAISAGLALGTLADLKNAFASCDSVGNCTCHWAGGSGNANCPRVGGCPTGAGGVYCPSGHTLYHH